MSNRGRTPEPDVVHQLKNHLGIVIGYTELLIESTPSDDRLRDDLSTIQQAARDALGLLPHLNAE
jgi:signal transduction histidine kinase